MIPCPYMDDTEVQSARHDLSFTCIKVQEGYVSFTSGYSWHWMLNDFWIPFPRRNVSTWPTERFAHASSLAPHVTWLRPSREMAGFPQKHDKHFASLGLGLWSLWTQIHLVLVLTFRECLLDKVHWQPCQHSPKQFGPNHKFWEGYVSVIQHLNLESGVLVHNKLGWTDPR